MYFEPIFGGHLPMLPTAASTVDQTFFIFGYGVTDNNGALPTILQRGSLSLIDLLTCRDTFGLSVANDNVFCGQAAFPSDGFTRICSGDQGGPVVNAMTNELVIQNLMFFFVWIFYYFFLLIVDWNCFILVGLYRNPSTTRICFSS